MTNDKGRSAAYNPRMHDQPAALRRISWLDLFPWLILFRTFRIAISPSLLALATVAVLLAPLGWRASGALFLTREQRADIGRVRIDRQVTIRQSLAAHIPAAVQEYLPAAESPILEAYVNLSEPVSRFFQHNLTLGESAYYAFGILWLLALWAFPGAVITRRAVVQLATDAPPGILHLCAFAARRYLWYFLAPLVPVLGLLLLALPIALLLGLPLRLSLGGGSILAGVLWIFVALASLVALWLVGGLMFGWPLMWPTISAERDGDVFEAFSRSFAYVYAKPLHYFFYVLVAAAFGALCWAVVESAAAIVEWFGFWSLGWGSGGARAETLRAAALAAARSDRAALPEESLVRFGATLIGAVLVLIRAVAIAFRYTFFFSVASAIYLLLRHDVDQKEMDEVHVESDPRPAPTRATELEPTPAAPSASP
jgi:hypothetical protein